MQAALRAQLSDDLELAAAVEAAVRRQAAPGVERYRYDAEGYITRHLGWEPWGGDADAPGQREVIAAYNAALKAQEDDPNAVVQNHIRIEAGHTVGKTKLASGLVNHFFDCYQPSIIYTYAPSWEQIHDLLWKEIKADRRDKGLPGRILDLELKVSDNHFAKGRATNNAGGQGTERAQGQHGKYLMFVLDEAEGIDDYVWNAVDSMTSGGISIVLMLANPRTRSSQFHKAAGQANVKSFRISCLQHPNVVSGQEIVPGAVKRAYVDGMIDKHCEAVGADEPDNHTFTVPWRPGIFRPNAEFLFRVMGIAPANISDNTFVPSGRYEAATKRQADGRAPHAARFGVDVARYGSDMGTLYINYAGALWRAAQFAQLDTTAYYHRIKDEALSLPECVTSLHIRVDGGGGFGGGVIDQVRRDQELIDRFAEFHVVEVHNNGSPHDSKAYADFITEAYAHAADALQALALRDVPEALEADLCEREFEWRKVGGIDVKKLEPKEAFRTRKHRSPDDGDGAVYAVAPDYICSSYITVRPIERQRSRWKDI